MYIQEVDRDINSINIYRPYHSRKEHWINIFISGGFPSKDIVCGGDINLVLKINETWGKMEE